LQYFFALIGDYESLIILLDDPPEVLPPSMNAESLAMAIRYKRTRKGDPLLDEHEHPVFDVFGKQVLCVGTWNDPKNVSQMLTSVGAIHAVHKIGRNETYSEPCKHCNALPKHEKFHGCHVHVSNARVWPRGNPATSETCINALKESTRQGLGYNPVGDQPWTPLELLHIRVHLVSRGTFFLGVQAAEAFVLMLIHKA
jgi:hypothetical protein